MCLFVALGLLTPRFIMILLWLLPTHYLSEAYDTWVWPLVGFVFLPTTTIAYAIAANEFGGFQGWGIAMTFLGIAIDLGLLGTGRGIFRCNRA